MDQNTLFFKTRGASLRLLRASLVFLLAASFAFLGANAQGAEAPSGLLTDLLEKTDVVWRDGFPTQLTLDELGTAVERVQIAEIRSSRPTFSWIVPSEGKSVFQTAWQIQLADSRDAFKEKTETPFVWDSGKVASADSTSVAFGASEPLKNSTIYYWRVRIWNQSDEVSDWSALKAFKTAENCEEFAVSYYPLVKEIDLPVASNRIDDKTTFFDFGRASFGRLEVEIGSNAPGQFALIRMGERVKDGRVDRKPAGTTRYWEYKLPLLPGRQVYSIKTRVDKRNSSGYAVLMPDYVGEVMPFRYAEVEILPGAEKNNSLFDAPQPGQVLGVKRESVYYPFDSTAKASYFHCDVGALNRVWALCRYSIKATSFAGYYVDGDRERIPYEGDALLNQLSHYAVDREYSLARRTQEYLIFHPTWPTEWNLQVVQMAWYDYLYNGDSRLIARYYDDLKAKSMIALSEENGLISTRKGKLTPEFLKSLHFQGAGGSAFQDIVDWPHKGLAGNENADSGETDGFVFNDFNVVVNSYHFFALNSMKRFAEILGKEEDRAFFEAQIEKMRKAFQETFFDEERGVYRDGEKTDHASLHGNMFPLAFGLVPPENVESVTKFVESRGMRCSVYGAQFLLEAAYEGENGDYGLERMIADDLRGWLNMLRVGSTITLEAWDDRYKPNQDWNHAWGAAPANIIPRKLVGVEPTSPGCATLRIKPQIADLKEVDAVVPTIRGAVEAQIRAQREENGVDIYQLRLNLPGNVASDVYLPAVDENDEIFVDDKPISEFGIKVAREGKFWKLAEVGSGIWKFERRAK